MARTVLMDTSFVVAIENADDPHHEHARELDIQLCAEGTTYLLHWGIILEIADGYSRLNRRQKGLQLLDRMLNEAGYEIQPVTESLLDSALEMYQSHADKEWGLTDCLSFVLMSSKGVTDALTADIHFQQAGFNALLLA